MTRLRRALAAIVGLGLLVAGCTAASHLKGIQPSPVPASSHMMMPQPAQPRSRMQLGIDIDAYTYPGQDIAAAAAADVAYIRSLNANAVSVSFPFFMSGPNADRVYADSATPTPSQLAIIVRTAKQAGLYVSIRPLLDEGGLGQSRVHWAPAKLRTWFASYRHFLMPYALMAQREHVSEFIVGAELSGFLSSPQWNTLDAALRRHYHGTLGCANNWSIVPGSCGRGVIETVDSYHPQHPPLLVGWEAYDSELPPHTVVTEVGIDAVRGAFRRPYQHHWSTVTLDPQVQARWFTAACGAAVATHLGGIYFWSLGLSDRVAGPTVAQQGYWAHSAGARAISRCFGSSKGSGL